MRRLRSWLVPVVVLALLIGGAYWVFDGGQDDTTYTGYFSRSTGLYAGDDVRVLGVRVGEIQSITPQRSQVKIVFTVRSDVPLPAGAKAAIVAPNLVTSRFLQVAPAWVSGPKLDPHDAIPLARTAVPVEWDDVKAQLTRLASALGPTLKDDDGALGGAIDTVDANLSQSAQQLHTMLHNLSLATDTLASNRGDLFGTVRGLENFVSALNAGDSSVRSFSAQLRDVSSVLDDNRSELATALTEVSDATARVTDFVKKNRSGLKSSVGQVEQLAEILNAKQYQITKLLHAAPTALSNFYNIIDPRYDAAIGSPAFANVDNLAQLVCTQVVRTGGTVQSCIDVLQPLLNKIGLLGLPTSASQAQSQFGGVTSSARTSPSTTAAPTRALPGGASDAAGLLGLLLPKGSL